MSKKNVTKNFKLSEEFNDYVVKHPDIFEGIPNNACIVFGVKNDPKLTKENLKLAEKIKKEERKKCLKAIKEKGKWILEAI